MIVMVITTLAGKEVHWLLREPCLWDWEAVVSLALEAFSSEQFCPPEFSIPLRLSLFLLPIVLRTIRYLVF